MGNKSFYIADIVLYPFHELLGCLPLKLQRPVAKRIEKKNAPSGQTSSAPLVSAMSAQKEFEEEILLGNKSLFLSSLGKTKEKIIKNYKT